jgi:ABC-type transport system substrate-binding protein
METVWKLQETAAWHDGTPVSAEDILFSIKIAQDQELPIRRERAFDFIDRASIQDLRTVVVGWKQPFIRADALFSNSSLMPRHLLEQAYLTEKANFAQLPYWGAEFIGTGPFKLRQWERSSHATLAANDAYILGRPRIDEIEMRFIPDPNTLVANILAGTVELTLGRGISLELAMTADEQWAEGSLATRVSGWYAVYPQLVNPSPPVIANVQFRRALQPNFHTFRKRGSDCERWQG